MRARKGFALKATIQGGPDVGNRAHGVQVAANVGGASEAVQVTEEVAAEGCHGGLFRGQGAWSGAVVGPDLVLPFEFAGEMIIQHCPDFVQLTSGAQTGATFFGTTPILSKV